MFGNKKDERIAELQRDINRLDKLINGDEYMLNRLGSAHPHRHHYVGIQVLVQDLRDENEKLKAIVAELCDYVYREKK